MGDIFKQKERAIPEDVESFILDDIFNLMKKGVISKTMLPEEASQLAADWQKGLDEELSDINSDLEQILKDVAAQEGVNALGETVEGNGLTEEQNSRLDEDAENTVDELLDINCLKGKGKGKK